MLTKNYDDACSENEQASLILTSRKYRLIFSKILVERLPLMPFYSKKNIHYVQRLAAVMKIAKFIVHSIYTNTYGNMLGNTCDNLCYQL